MSFRPLIAFVAALLLIGAPSAGAAAPGTPDPSFGVDGIGGGALGPAYEEAAFEDLRIEADGTLRVSSGSLDASYRFLPDGAVDPGLPAQPLAPVPAEATQSDGKVLVVDSDRGRIRRLDADGTIDTSFDGGVSEPFSTERQGQNLADFQVRIIAPLPSGQILVAGEETLVTGTKESETLARLGRLDADGTVDREFGDDGSLAVPAPGGLIDVVPTPAGGCYLVFSEGVVKVGPRGTATPAFASRSASGAEIELVGGHALSGGGIAIAGTQRRDELSSGAVFVAHYSPGKTLDNAFAGGRGETAADFAGVQEASSVSWEADGSVLVGAVSTEGIPHCRVVGLCADTPVVIRFAADGSVDPSFGEGGESRLTALTGGGPVSRRAGVLSIAPRPGGGFLLGGGGGPGTTTAFLAALEASGTIDPSFGVGGIVTVRREKPSTEEGGPIAVTGDGKILVAAHSDAGTASLRSGVIGYLPDGTIDRDFGTEGFAPVRMARSEVAIAATKGDGAVLASRTDLFRIDADGRPDEAFGVLGRATPLESIGNRSPGAHLNAVATLPDGRIIAAGATNDFFSLGSKMLIVRLRADGRLDRSFGDSGVVELGCRHSALCQASALAVRPGGEVVIAATAVGEGEKRSFHVVLAQLSPGGALDRRFGDRGFAFLPGRDRAAAPLLALTGRRALVAGSSEFRPNLAFLARFDGDGHPDLGFGKRGSVGIPSRMEPSALLPVGSRIVLAGSGTPTVIGYRSDGIRERSFRTYALDGPSFGASAAIQGGAVVLAWTTSKPAGSSASRHQVKLVRLAG